MGHNFLMMTSLKLAKNLCFSLWCCSLRKIQGTRPKMQMKSERVRGPQSQFGGRQKTYARTREREKEGCQNTTRTVSRTETDRTGNKSNYVHIKCYHSNKKWKTLLQWPSKIDSLHHPPPCKFKLLTVCTHVHHADKAHKRKFS